MSPSSSTIDLRLFATLAAKAPANASAYTIEAGTSVAQLLEQIQVSPTEAKLVFINGVRARQESRLYGGERVGIFPPVGGG